MLTTRRGLNSKTTSTCTLMGTFCRFSSRLVAVMTISLAST